jgi:hypothetical protein
MILRSLWVYPQGPAMNRLLTFPDSAGMALSIRAKALLFHDPISAR